MVLLLNTGVFAQCNEKYGKTLCVPPGGNEVLAKGKVIIQKLINGENVDADSSGLSKREWNELMVTFDLKDKLI